MLKYYMVKAGLTVEGFFSDHNDIAEVRDLVHELNESEDDLSWWIDELIDVGLIHEDILEELDRNIEDYIQLVEMSKNDYEKMRKNLDEHKERFPEAYQKSWATKDENSYAGFFRRLIKSLRLSKVFSALSRTVDNIINRPELFSLASFLKPEYKSLVKIYPKVIEVLPYLAHRNRTPLTKRQKKVALRNLRQCLDVLRNIKDDLFQKEDYINTKIYEDFYAEALYLIDQIEFVIATIETDGVVTQKRYETMILKPMDQFIKDYGVFISGWEAMTKILDPRDRLSSILQRFI